MTVRPAAACVSVVITTYNHARFLAEAIDSVRNQSVRPDEIIVVDDGSLDNPENVVRRYVDVHYIRQGNQGLAAARNTGMKAARGEFIAFLDADDRLRPTALATNLALFHDSPDCALVYGAYCYIDEAGAVRNSVPLRPVGEDPYAGFLTGNLIGMHATVLYRRSTLEAAGGFDRSLRACEDYDVYLRLSRANKAACTPECLADYRRHATNMSNSNPMMLRAALKVLGRQRNLARTNPDWTAAYHQGVENWKRYYAHMQLGQLSTAVRSRSSLGGQLLNTIAVSLAAPLQTTMMLRQRFKGWSSRRRSGVRFGDLSRPLPFSTNFGFDRGKPVDRRYVETFLASCSLNISGRVLEIGDNAYTTRFGGSRVARSDVLNRYEGHPLTTFVGDLANGDDLPLETFDCIVLTQTLHLLFNMPVAVATLWRMLKPGGVLLVTVPWVSPIDRGEWGESWFWSITPAALGRLLSDRFGVENVEVRHYGNAYSATGFLYGLAEHELNSAMLDVHDPCCPVIVAARAFRRRAA
ncbi:MULTISPECIES: glycosyltransferase [unclassified Mesorhizobium]|uniref:glycosyltransferase n=2 Tax=unclassified Mesorhizobium TaxID=325217 RepID=UPI00112E26E0|nr:MULTISPECIES: glycosyltransferase [unclassified Mesorhizobium]MBZ9985018.1 bifunctional glycosyltransferase/class I SAM-dependent methyltransferase [Mesorhizobium sp. BR-1-1-8]TPL27482.1 glycosyltransferase [Mesorhizobium sp. B2-4-8]TPL59372.1 glycosyltransferase [Mesorhizobium sp. B2-4-1]